MALKRLKNGQYIIKTEKEAKAALAMFSELVDEAEAIRQESGLKELEEDAVELKKSVAVWMVQKKKDHLELDNNSVYGKLIEQGYDKRVIATQDELDSYMQEAAGRELVQPRVIPLRKLFVNKFGKGTKDFKDAWKRATKPVADITALDEMVAEGTLTVKELAKCYAEKKKTPYLRLFGKE